MKKIQVALIGCGYLASYHARGLQPLSDVEIVAVAGLPIEAAQAFAQKYNIKEATTGLYNTKGYANVFPTFLKYKVGGLPAKL